MGRVIQRTRVVRIERDAVRPREDRLAVEEPLELRLGGVPHAVTSRTPGHDSELAHGCRNAGADNTCSNAQSDAHCGANAHAHERCDCEYDG